MLDSLELFGFKSFAERTKFDFADGVTAVVGPNGSGKSNVVDAIKWVLGDQSAKSLRGKEMTDVIFNGAAGRKASNFAEVLLTFNNERRFLPLEQDRVCVGRRLWRNGDSEYLLDGQTARLKDVRRLFMGTGAGSSAYAIIEQGRVEQILQANALGRRAVFEEAAGISRYQSKRTESLRRLERVEQNLLRLTDIVDEVEARLNATRTQAEKASAYRELTQDLERTWLGLAADDYRHEAGQLATLREELAEQQQRRDADDQEAAPLTERAAGLDAQLGELASTAQSLERAAARTREEAASGRARYDFQSSRLVEIGEDLVKLRRSATALRRRAAEGHQERAANERAAQETETEISGNRRRRDQRERELERLTTEQEALERRLSELRGQVTDCQEAKAEVETGRAAVLAEQESLGRARAELARRHHEVNAEWESATTAVGDHREALAQAEAMLRHRQGTAGDLRAARNRLAEQREELVAAQARLREQRSATAARIGVLQDMQDRGEGFGIGVREILRRARSLREAPWNQIYGTVADLLDVDLDDAPLLEIALGDRAQLLVIESFEALLPYLGRSSARITGRVGFLAWRSRRAEQALAGARYIEAYPVGSAVRTEHDDRARSGWSAQRTLPGSHDLRGLPGVIKRADELVHPTSRMPQLAERLLQETWIVQDLASALRLAAGHGRTLRFVTTSGELLDSDGTLVVGTLRTEAAVISRRSELIRLRRSLRDVEKSLEQADRDAVSLAQSQREVTAGLAEADAQCRDALDAFNHAKAALSRAETHLGRQREERDRLSGELGRHDEQLARLAERLATLRDEGQALVVKLTAFGEEIEQSQTSLHEIERRTLERENAIAAGALELAKAEERLVGLREANERLIRDGRQRAAQHAEAVRRLDAALRNSSQTTCHLLNAAAGYAEASWRNDRHEARHRGLASRRRELQSQRGTLSRAESELVRRRRETAEAIHATELALSQRDQRLAALGERIREEFDRDLVELADSAHSAIALWVETRQGNNVGQAFQPDNATDNNAQSITVPPYEEIRPEIEARLERLRKKLRKMGTVNSESLEELDSLEERHEQLSRQLQDLLEAKQMLEEVIRRINTESKRLFEESFERIRGHFRKLFRELFGGGEGDIVLERGADLLECGIDIVARPPGKELRSLSLLSGGEKTLTCVALLMAIFRSKPSPFCLLDEVDAALDEANIGRFIAMLAELKAATQFIMITHRKPSMGQADLIWGVTMEQAGVSKRLSVSFDEIDKNGQFRATKSAKRRRAA